MPSRRHRLSSFLAEVRRRRVIRVAVVYLIAAWGAIEVGETILPNVGAPQWTVTAVIVLAALGLPVTLVLAWYFDVTPEGVERTASLQPPRAPLSPRQRLARIGLAALGVGIPLTLGGWYVVERARPELDADLVAVMPFRTAGTAPSLEHLREGMQILLSRALWGEQGLPEAVEPLRIDRALRERLGGLAVDPDDDEATDIARSLGAGRVISGEIVGDGEGAVFHFAVHDARRGRVLLRHAIRAHPDSVERVAGLIATRLLASEAGVPLERLTAVTTTSPAALRAYLEGERERRRGRHAESRAAFDLALELDSTFLLAAMGMVRTKGWADHLISPAHEGVAFRQAYSRRDELAPADQLYLQAHDPDWPGLTWSMPEFLDARELAVRRSPQSIDLLFLLADGYFHAGARIGMQDPDGRAAELLERVVELDTAHYEALDHLALIAARHHDYAGLARWQDLLLAIDSTSPAALFILDTRSRIPEIGRPGIRLDLDTLPARVIVAFGHPAFPQTLVERNDAVLRALGRTRDPADRQLLLVSNAALAMQEGRASIVDAMFDSLPANERWTRLRLRVALIGIPDSAQAARAAEHMARLVEEHRSRILDGGVSPYADDACLLLYYRLFYEPATATGTAASIRTEIEEWARDSASARTRGVVREHVMAATDLCTALAEATVAVRNRTADARQRLEHVDDLLRRAPTIGFHVDIGNFQVSRLWEEAGAIDRAFRAMRRNASVPVFWATALGEEARLADQLGMREEAIRLYSRYLEIRQRPDPPVDETVRRARERLVALTAEPPPSEP